jgi:tripartite-type tricarboxylate transporter receptor subunit TctC
MNIRSFLSCCAEPRRTAPRCAALGRAAGMLVALIALSCLPLAALGQKPAAYPSKPVRIVVSFAAGGGLDMMARLVAKKLSEQMGQQFIVENRPGAGGTIGAAAAAAAPADGYTLLAGGNPEITVMPHLMEKLPYDPLRDLAPVVLATYVPSVLVVNPAVQSSTTVSQLVDAARKSAIPVATPGKGTPMHIALEILNAQAGTQFINTPYRGGGPAVQDVVAGQVGTAIVNLPPLKAHIASGRVRALAVMQAERSPQLPDVPTLKEASGIDNVSAPAWFAFMAPAAVPKDVLARLESEIRTALSDPGLTAQLATAGMDVAALPADRFDRLLRAESAANASAIKRFSISAE